MSSQSAATLLQAEPPRATPSGDISLAVSPLLVMLNRDRIAEAETFRALRTHIVARHIDDGRRALAVCGATAEVGVTFVAANLAIALSQAGIKTLLIDANLRRPSLEQLIVPSAPVNGLVQCLLSDDEAYSDFIYPEVLPDFSVMYSGGTPLNAQELLASERFSRLMSFCLRDYDMTVLDTPAANLCSDATLVSAVVGYGLVVARKNKSLIGDVKTLISQLEDDRARIVGTVMTEF